MEPGWTKLKDSFIEYISKEKKKSQKAKILKDSCERYELNNMIRCQTFKTKKSDERPSLNLLQIPSLDMAKQLCLVEQHYFQKINISEFYHTKWNSKWGKKPRQSPHLSTVIERYNTIGYWIATTIIDTDDLTPKDRAQIISYWINVMNELINNNNFNSSSQIFSALNMNCVRRLQKTWTEVPKTDLDIFDRVGDVMSFSSNFSTYRERLKLVPTENPCIPRVEVVLKDLTFTEEHKDITEDGKVNFVKIHKLYRALQSISSFQTESRNYNKKFIEEEAIQQFIHHITSLSEAELETLSKNLKSNKEKPIKKKRRFSIDDDKDLYPPGKNSSKSFGNTQGAPTSVNSVKKARKKSENLKSRKKVKYPISKKKDTLTQKD